MTQHELNEQLFNAARHNNTEKVRTLLDAGADIDVKNNYGRTVLIWACWNGHTDIARLLIEHGADINIRNNEGQTALDILKEECPSRYQKLIEDTVIKARKDQLNTEDSLTGPVQDILPDWNI